MDKRTAPKKIAFLAVAALAIVLAVNAPSQAADAGGHGFGGGHPGFGGGHPGGAVAHHGFDGRHFDGHRFDARHFERRHFDRGVHGHVGFGFGFVPVLPYYGYDPSYTYDPSYSYDQAPGYWYYCPSYGVYYPNVTTCPEAWVPVPAS